MAAPRAEKAYERYAWIIPFALGTFAFILGLVVALTGDPNFKSITGMTLDQLSSTNPAVASYIAYAVRYLGTTDLTAGFFVMAISLKSYRRGEKWSWYALWAFPVLIGLHTGLDFSAGLVMVGENGIVVLVVFLLGLLLPVRKFFPRK